MRLLPPWRTFTPQPQLWDIEYSVHELKLNGMVKRNRSTPPPYFSIMVTTYDNSSTCALPVYKLAEVLFEDTKCTRGSPCTYDFDHSPNFQEFDSGDTCHLGEYTPHYNNLYIRFISEINLMVLLFYAFCYCISTRTLDLHPKRVLKRFIGLFPILIFICNGYVHHTLWVLGLPLLVFIFWFRQFWWTMLPAFFIVLLGEYRKYKNKKIKTKTKKDKKQIKIQSDHGSDQSFILVNNENKETNEVFCFDEEFGGAPTTSCRSNSDRDRFPPLNVAEQTTSIDLARDAVVSESISPERRKVVASLFDEMIKVKIQSSHAPIFGADFHTLVMMITGSRHLFSTKSAFARIFPYFDASVISRHLWNILENTFLLFEDLSRCNTFSQACVAFYRTFKILFGNEPWIYNFASNFIELVQSEWNKIDIQGSSCEMFTTLSQIISGSKMVVEGPILEKLGRVLQYLLSFSAFSALNICNWSDESSFQLFRTFSHTLKKQPLKFGKDFFVSVLDLVEFLIDRGVVFFKNPDKVSVLTLFTDRHHGFDAWCEDVRVLTQLHRRWVMSDKQLNVTEFKHLLRSTLTTGKEFARVETIASTFRTLYQTHMSDLYIMDQAIIDAERGAGIREQPFGIHLYGFAGIGKTGLIHFIREAFALISSEVHEKLDGAPRYMYSRTQSEFWDNYDSSQWCILMDDLAENLFRDNGDVDQGIEEFIQLMNTVPFMTNQASLERKGRVFAEPKLVMSTSNNPELNIQETKFCTAAFWRRYNCRIHVELKKECSTDLGLYDHSLVQEQLRSNPNFFPYKLTIERYRYRHQKLTPRQLVVFEDDCVITEKEDFLRYLCGQMKTHFRKNEAMCASISSNTELTFCARCERVLCECSRTVNIQGDRARRKNESAFTSFHMLPFFFFIFPETFWTGLFLSCLSLSHLTYCMAMSRWWQWYAVTLGLLVCKGIIAVGYLLQYILEWILKTKFTEIPVDTVKTKKVWPGSCLWNYFVQTNRHYVDKCRRKTQKGLHWLSRKLDWFVKCELKVDAVGWQYLQYAAWGVAAIIAIRKFADTFLRDKMKVQGSYVSKPKLAEEKVRNYYEHKPDALISGDFSHLSKSWNALSRDQLVNILSRYVADVTFYAQDGAHKAQFLNLCGQLWVTSMHHFKDRTVTHFDMTMFDASGPHPQRRIVLDRESMRTFPGSDLAVIVIKDVPAGKHDLKHLLCEGKIPNISLGFCLKRQDDGSLHILKLANIKPVVLKPDSVLLPGTYTFYQGTVTEGNTKAGDCGAPVFGLTGNGPVLLGLHTYQINEPGKDCYNGCIALTRGDICSKMKSFDNVFLVQGGQVSNVGNDKTGNLHPRSPFRYCSGGHITIYGSFTTRPTFTSKSKVGKTAIYDQALALDYIQDEYGPPVMKHWEPKQIALADMLGTGYDQHPTFLSKSVEGFTQDILQALPKDELGLCELYDRELAVNGYPGTNFVDPIKIKTSMGHPYNRPKTEYLIFTSDDVYTRKIELTPEVSKEVDDIMACYQAGKRYNPIFTAHLKDEPTSLEKIKKKKTRVFCGAPAAWVIVVRMHLLSFVRLMQRNRYAFETAVGIAAHSKEWGKLAEYLRKHTKTNFVAGDFKAFDKKMAPCYILAAFRVIRDVYAASGMSSEDLRIIDCIAHDIAFPHVNFFGDLVMFWGTNPSGHPLTVIINSLVNSIYMRMAFLIAGPENLDIRNFQKCVSTISYGDDNAMGVHSSVPWFNHTTIAEALATIGVEYTMADKKAESVPYIPLSQLSFLKREFVYDRELERWMAPLSHSSICKMLTKCLRGANFDPGEHSMAVIRSAMFEYIQYGREVYESRRKDFLHILDAQLSELDDLSIRQCVDNACIDTWDQAIESLDN